MQTIDKEQIQGIIKRGYNKLPESSFLLLSITDKKFTKLFIKDILLQINTAAISPTVSAINIAFTYTGLDKLEIPTTALHSFSREFKEGMHDDYRASILGDEGDNHPNNWGWGNKKLSIDILLMVYANDKETLQNIITTITNNDTFKNGIQVKHQKENSILKENKEHFGFRDGITQPPVSELVPENVVLENPIQFGEFVLGYKNEYNKYTDMPLLKKEEDTTNIFEHNEKDNFFKNFGKNGSYLIFRELEQDVPSFWNYLYNNAPENGIDKIKSAIMLGAKMVGRWLNGAPITQYDSNTQNTYDIKKEKNFGYADTDKKGLKCPFGAHIRRTNPRDQLIDHDKNDSTEMIRKHQLLRRGRAFGNPVADSMEPQDIINATTDTKEKRGLYFICINANIARQFEFVQSIWVNSAKFSGLYKDGDPIIGARITKGEYRNDEFTCPAVPIRSKYTNLPQFTKTVGGSYFFLPSINALKFISQ